MPSRSEKWVEITIAAPIALADAISSFITDQGSLGVIEEEIVVDAFDDIDEQEGLGKIRAYFPDDDTAAMKVKALGDYLGSLSQMFPELDPPEMKSETIADPDWEEQWKKYFKPLRISRDIVIDIDPGMAFGTGQHPSTRMCINAMEEIIPKDRTFETWAVLDVGTGTGILAISAAKLGAQQVIALDLDLKAVEIAEKNTAINRVEDRIEILNQDVLTYQGRFNLIVANLTASTLIPLRDHLDGMLEPGGYLVLSGIIEKDAPLVEETFLRQESLASHQLLSEKEWVCFVLRKRREAP